MTYSKHLNGIIVLKTSELLSIRPVTLYGKKTTCTLCLKSPLVLIVEKNSVNYFFK